MYVIISVPQSKERAHAVINEITFVGFLSIVEFHRFADTRPLLSSCIFLPATRIKRNMLKIAIIDSHFPLQINNEISMQLVTPLVFIESFNALNSKLYQCIAVRNSAVAM